MADADTRYKRASATALLLPFMYTCHTDGVADVDAEERVFVTWMYMGISTAVAPVISWLKRNKRIILFPYRELE